MPMVITLLCNLQITGKVTWSGYVVGSLLTLYLLLLTVSRVNVWRILPMGLLGQAAILLWFKMFRPVKEDNNE